MDDLTFCFPAATFCGVALESLPIMKRIGDAKKSRSLEVALLSPRHITRESPRLPAIVDASPLLPHAPRLLRRPLSFQLPVLLRRRHFRLFLPFRPNPIECPIIKDVLCWPLDFLTKHKRTAARPAPVDKLVVVPNAH